MITSFILIDRVLCHACTSPSAALPAMSASTPRRFLRAYRAQCVVGVPMRRLILAVCALLGSDRAVRQVQWGTDVFFGSAFMIDDTIGGGMETVVITFAAVFQTADDPA
jgi:hypothetical protein